MMMNIKLSSIPDVRLRYCVNSSNCVLVRAIRACSSSPVRVHQRSLAWICWKNSNYHLLHLISRRKEEEWMAMMMMMMMITCNRIRCYLRNRPRSIPDSNSWVVELWSSRTTRAGPRGKRVKWSERHRRRRLNGRKPLHDSLVTVGWCPKQSKKKTTTTKIRKNKKIVIIIKFNHRLVEVVVVVVVAREGKIPSFLSETISRMQMSGRRPSFVTNGVSKSKRAYDLGSSNSPLAAELGHSSLIVSDFHWTNHTRLVPKLAPLFLC